MKLNKISLVAVLSIITMCHGFADLFVSPDGTGSGSDRESDNRG